MTKLKSVLTPNGQAIFFFFNDSNGIQILPNALVPDPGPRLPHSPGLLREPEQEKHNMGRRGVVSVDWPVGTEEFRKKNTPTQTMVYLEFLARLGLDPHSKYSQPEDLPQTPNTFLPLGSET